MARKKREEPALPPPLPPLMCWTPGCPYDARVRRRVGKNAVGAEQWRDYCFQCDDRYHTEESTKWCLERGLDTVEKKRALCLEQLKHGGKKLRESLA